MLKIIIFLSILELNPCLSFSMPCYHCHWNKNPNPVCGTSGKTYENGCLAECSGWVSKETIVAPFARSKDIFSLLLVKALVLANLFVPVQKS